jgi:hypothetical protein
MFAVTILLMAYLPGCSPAVASAKPASPFAEVSVSTQATAPSVSPVQSAATASERTPELTPKSTASPVPKYSPEEISTKRDLLVLMMAYPGFIKGFEKDKNGLISLIMKSGGKILYNDKKKKMFDEDMADADLQDSLSLPYPLTDYTKLAEGNSDPGRFRPYAFFNAIYGNGEKAIKANLTSVNLGSVKVKFNKSNGASAALKKVFDKLNSMIAAEPDIKSSVYPLSGTFKYRYIAGTELLSMHSFGIAIDLHAKENPSHNTISRKNGQKRIDTFPRGVVSAFEANGFIWGGKWAHFDIMHFEYRPEIILKAKYRTNVKEGDPWYAGFPDNEQVKNCVKLIDNSLG